MTQPQLIEAPEPSEERSPGTLATALPSAKLTRHWLKGLLLILLLGGGGAGYWWFSQSQARPGAGPMIAGPRAVPVKWQVLEPKPVEQATVLVGTLEANRASNITSEVDGRISQILVQEGEAVTAGQEIIHLDSETLQAELTQARAALARNQAALAELKAGTRREDIAEAQATLQQSQARLANAKGGSSPEAIAQAQAQLNAAKATAELASSRVQRYKNLRDEGVIPLDTYDQQVKEQRQTLAEVQSAQRRLSELKKERGSELEQLTAEVEQQRQNLTRLKNGPRPEDIAQAQAQVAESLARIRSVEVQLAKLKITAPFAGTIGYIPAKVGNYVQAGDRLTTITENQDIDLNLSVPLGQAGQLHRGLPVEILDSQNQPLAKGRISFISPNVNNEAQTVLARASFSNAKRQLLNQQLVQAKIVWNQGQGLLVPATAIARVGGETFIYLAQSVPDKKTGKPQLVAVQKAVQLGALQGNDYQVVEGVQAGAKVITSGLLNLQDGVPIMEAGKPLPPAGPGKG
ncbi:efflux RND transporter periplasmic adaptor subunit [Synechocystis sp. LKSZ1]|uniref:efflux RND transporter periplasmic adaptor subunit n=1 Tax=Synechocystis sp. LKSZ1 TaxID=3144951 RepID=UPI00336BCA0F